jgi:hypothetical protein
MHVCPPKQVMLANLSSLTLHCFSVVSPFPCISLLVVVVVVVILAAVLLHLQE